MAVQFVTAFLIYISFYSNLISIIIFSHILLRFLPDFSNIINTILYVLNERNLMPNLFRNTESWSVIRKRRVRSARQLSLRNLLCRRLSVVIRKNMSTCFRLISRNRMESTRNLFNDFSTRNLY